MTAQPESLPQAIANPTQGFSHLHIDILGPLPQSPSSHSLLLTVVDHSTRWAEAIPLQLTTAKSCATAGGRLSLQIWGTAADYFRQR
jgi:hypothetical protein